MEARNLAIMLTDIKGFTSKTASFSRAQTQELLARHRELVLPVIEKFHGRLVKTIGDAFLVVFNSPTDAVICGVQVQEALKAHNADKPQQEKIEIRIAINAGEVAVHDDGDIYGDPVNITSRLESIAEAGEVFFTEAVKWVSRLRATVTNDEMTRPILLRTEMAAGHGGRSGRYAAWEQVAWEWAFVLDQLGATSRLPRVHEDERAGGAAEEPARDRPEV